MLKRAILILSLFCLSLEGNCKNHNFKQPPKLGTLCCNSATIGAVVVGAGAGALAGWAASSKQGHHRHSTLIDSFKREEADTLDAELELTINTDADFPEEEMRLVNIKPFIAAPNGEVFLNESSANNQILKGMFKKTIALKSVSKPYLGNYHFGCSLEFSEDTNIVQDFRLISLKVKIKNRQGETSVLDEFIPWSFNDLGNHIEMGADYTYHPKL